MTNPPDILFVQDDRDDAALTLAALGDVRVVGAVVRASGGAAALARGHELGVDALVVRPMVFSGVPMDVERLGALRAIPNERPPAAPAGA